MVYRLATKHKEANEQTIILQAEAADACDVNKASPQCYRKGAATASSWRFGSAAVPYVVRSTIGLLSDSYALVENL